MSEIVSMLRSSTGLDITAIGFTVVGGEVNITLTLSGSTALLGANKAMSVGEKDFESDKD